MASIPVMQDIIPVQPDLAVQGLVDRAVFPKSSLDMMPDNPPAEAGLAIPGPEVASGLTVPSQGQSEEANVEGQQRPINTASEQDNTNHPQAALPTLSKNDIETVLNNAGLLSLHYNPTTDQFQHEMRHQLDKDRDFVTVQSLLNAPGCMKKDNSFVPRLDLFLVDCSFEDDFESNYINMGDGWKGAIPDAAKIQARHAAARILHNALQIPSKIAFYHCLRTEKVSAHTMGPTHEAPTCSSYHITSVDCNLVWSYSAKTRQTVGIVLYRYAPGALPILNHLVPYLIAHRSLAACSMFLALAAQVVLASALEHLLWAYSDGVVRTERRTGYSHFPNSNGTDASKKDFDPAAETAEVSGLAGLLAINHNSWEGLQALADLGLQETQELIQGLKDTDPPKWQSDLTFIKELMVCSVPKFAARCAEAASLQSRASIQIQGLFNIIAQREQELSRQLTRASLQLGEATRQIAEDSKRDSTSMKAIAAVTMFFLPGTFAASLFAMPVFRWNANSGNDVVSHRIWVYWAVTIPLTLITFGCFLLWDHLMNKPRYPHTESLQASNASLRSLATSKLSADTPESDSASRHNSGAISTHDSGSTSRDSIISLRRSIELPNKRRPTSTHTAPYIRQFSRDVNTAGISGTANLSRATF